MTNQVESSMSVGHRLTTWLYLGEDRMRNGILMTFVALVALTSFQANAQWGPVTARVTLIDAGGMGARSGDSIVPVVFNIDQAISGNPCGTTGSSPATLLYVPYAFANGTGDTAQPTGNDRQLANSKAALSSLQLALATGFNVKIWGYSGGSGFCQVYAIQLLNN